MFQPSIPLGGITGWRLLERTEAVQRTAFEQSPQFDRDVQYFRENISGIAEARDLVADRRLLSVALGAFGLDEEIYKKAFLEKILAEGTEDDDALALKFVDPRYREFSDAFGFGSILGPKTADIGFADRIIAAYKTRQFEVAVGNQDENMRLALTFRREMETYSSSSLPDDTNWLRIMGNRPLREVFQAAYNLPSEFATIDIDKQREILADRTGGLLGDDTLAAFRDPENVQRVIDRFLLRKQIEQGPSAATPGAAALTLLQSAGSGFGVSARIGLILSGA